LNLRSQPFVVDLPFEHQDILVYIDNLFLEGKLAPIKWSGSIVGHDWTQSGLVSEKEADIVSRLDRLQATLYETFPSANCRYSDWLSFARKWAGLQQMVEIADSKQIFNKNIEQLRVKISLSFADWLHHHYASLINLSPISPAMLHHVPRHIARELEDNSTTRVALIVVDGLSLSQWATVRHVLQEQDTDGKLVIRESATFAWIPTLTSVSRQALFAGSPPFYFPSSIATTAKESKLWKKFWEGIGLSRLEVAYQKGLGDGNAVQTVQDIVTSGRSRVIGLVVDKVDKIMHGMQLGATGMHNQITQWCREGFLSSLINYLLENNYQVWLTSDHGNVECVGMGSPLEGSIAETKGERVRIYPTRDLRSSIAQQFDASLKWDPIGLPPDYFPLLAKDNTAFVQEKKKIF